MGMKSAPTMWILALLLICLHCSTVQGQGVVLEFSEVDRSAPEVDGVLMVEIIKQGTNTGSMTLQVTPITIGNFVATYGTLPAEFTMINLNIPDPAELSDFDGASQTVVVSPSDTASINVGIPLNDDGINEAAEGFILIMEVVTATTNDAINLQIGRNVSLGTINDDDNIVLSFTQTTYMVDETVGILTSVMVEKEGGIMSEQTISINVETDGTVALGIAERFVDFNVTSTSLMVTLAPSQQSVVVEGITIVDDDLLEGPELFTLSLGNPVGSPSGVRLGTQSTVVTILDDERLVIGFVMQRYEVTEGTAAVEVCVEVSEPLPVTPPMLTFPPPGNGFVQLSAIDDSATAGTDFSALLFTFLTFTPLERTICHNISITDDTATENTEQFRLTIAFPGTSPPANLVLRPDNANVTILDNDGLVIGNDTVIGDPLFAISFLEDLTSLCFEVHGCNNTFINLVSDMCTSVNAFYTAMQIPNNGNIISQVGVRTVGDSGQCYNIRVDLTGCVATVDGTPVANSYEMDNIQVQRTLNLVRISVPNCEDESNLIMDVTCSDNPEPMIRFNIVRGLNLRPTSHGLLGQFWNIPITTHVFDAVNNSYIVTVEPPGRPARHFISDRYNRVWDNSRRVCYYTGNGQGGRSGETLAADDSVIEGNYRDYLVADLFSDEFLYEEFENERCTS